MTITGGQRDDDADGRGNRYDFDYDNAGAIVPDFNEMKASVGDLGPPTSAEWPRTSSAPSSITTSRAW
jgi:hypothetical protein